MRGIFSERAYIDHIELVKGYQRELASPIDARRSLFCRNSILLHKYFFRIIQTPTPLIPGSLFENTIIREFGSVRGLVELMVENAVKCNGWTVLVLDNIDGCLQIFSGDNHAEFPILAQVVIAVDCYEHAYFIDYGPDKQSYLETFFSQLDWRAIEGLYMQAKRQLTPLEI